MRWTRLPTGYGDAHGRSTTPVRAICSAAVLLLASASAVSAQLNASPYNRDCGTAMQGGLTKNERWKTNGPWHVRMSYETARRIARRVGPSEFQPPGSHPDPGDVSCVVASSVAFAGANGWAARQESPGLVSVRWTGYASGPSFGRFRCVATTRRPGAIDETCSHKADRHAGAIVVQFTVRPA
jgi:hypothetical protein